MDAVEIQSLVTAYIEAQKHRVADANDQNWWAVDRFFELMDSMPEICWQAIVEISRRNPSEEIIAITGAGPLEDLIEQYGDQFIDKIEAEARESPVFRKMLNSVWESGSSEIWSRVIQAKSSDT
ncbi:DUF6869 domain-containing protein [Xanthomonas albilineans]|uniref:DUF6869 domain-containing protein n=1 Tax=Xanthomonas albilineans TaxID=29447 RepID=UPI0005F3529B|nr:hypothetical protein [Xanthomonas albilineans]